MYNEPSQSRRQQPAEEKEDDDVRYGGGRASGEPREPPQVSEDTQHEEESHHDVSGTDFALQSMAIDDQAAIDAELVRPSLDLGRVTALRTRLSELRNQGDRAIAGLSTS